MIRLFGTHNCAVFELEGISFVKTPEEMFKQSWALVKRVDVDFPFLNFTGVTKRSFSRESSLHIGLDARTDNYGQAFADYIVNHGLGEIVPSGARKNWSDNMVQLWVWIIDRAACREHMAMLEAKEV